MPLFEYKCLDCGLLSEKLVMAPNTPDAESKCPRCGAQAKKRDYPSSVALVRSGMDNAPLDNAVGKSANDRWGKIHDRQSIKDKVRKESGEVGLTVVGPNQFKPITPEQKQLRNSLTETIAATGGYRSNESH